MNSLIAGALAALAIGSAQAQPQVGVSVSVRQPGVWGRVDIGGLPPPALVLPQPVLIAPPRVVVVQREPIYLYVPPTHQQNWRRYCGRYSACGQPVYFVQDRWVRERYAEHHPGWYRGRHRGWEKHGGHDRDHDRDHGSDRRR